MKVLIGMESSGTIREAFRNRGHDAWSCDLLPADDNSKYHMKFDIFEAVYSRHWDLIICHPVCTKLCVSGNHVYARGKEKYDERKIAVLYVDRLWWHITGRCEKVCFENPVGVLSTMSNLPKPYYIQPYEFGHNASKKTGLFTKGLPKLKPTERVQGRFVNGKERWNNQTDSGQNRLGSSKDRWKMRLKTYSGIAKAMAEQWG